MRARFMPAALAVSALMAGCSGGGGGSSPNPIASSPATSSPAQAQSIAAIGDTNAFGSPLKDFADFDKSADTSRGTGLQTSASSRQSATGACNDGVEFFAPDKNGDADSTETIDFYDTACTDPARDLVRIYTSTGASSETVALTESIYAPENATAIATRTEAHTITNASFNANGYPLAANGYDLVASDALTIGGAKTIDSNREIVVTPSSGGTNTFCSDSSGFNATGFPKLALTFGWQGGVLAGGTRTQNADGSITWTATQAGTAYKGPIGGLSVATGTQNTSCPIATPMFALAGGTAIGSYSLPISVTYAHGMLVSLTITNATLGDGDSLSVATNTSLPPTSSQYVTGSVSIASTQIATFAVDAYGDGTLTVTASGAQYVITDWHVAR